MQQSLRSRRLRAVDVQVYTICEHLTEGLLYFMIIFSPWAFGTTQPWSIWIMNSAGYLTGILLLAKIFIRSKKGYIPPRWSTPALDGQALGKTDVLFKLSRLRAILVFLTFAILLYCFISVLNAAATHNREVLTFEYHSYLPWLPHSFDSNRTWNSIASYFALACAFWALADWLPGKSDGEERAARQKSLKSSAAAPAFPARLRRVLWILCVNGALVGLEGIIQRLEGSGRLLFIIKPEINSEALSQFGPYHYRANASAYFNLIWPVCLGFWWTLHRTASSRAKRHHLLLLCGLVMAACPIISTSRAGALITAGQVVGSLFFLVVTHFLLKARGAKAGKQQKLTFVLLGCFFTGALALGLAFGWKTLKPRLGLLKEGFVGREEMYEIARPMARDYPWFGTGPGTFESVFQLYRISTETYWPAQLHNDWLETRITFGRIGLALILLALLTVLFRWFTPGGLHGGRRFMILTWIALAGVLVHARFDFPFQIYSILFLFLALCAIAFNLSRR